MDSSVNIHVCADVSLFTSYQAGGTRVLLIAVCPLHQEESC
jgi:hypothetical protein